MNPSAILIVEDVRLIAKGLEKQLKSMGYGVIGMASTGEDAVLKAVALRPDLILMDISLGAGIDGIEAAGLIRQQLDVPVVYLTANSDDATLERAKSSGPFGYVLKPYEDKDLQTTIEIGLYRHKMERRLRENEEWLSATLASISNGVIATDDQRRVRLMNSVAEKLTGWKQSDALGRDVREIFHIVGEKSRLPVPNPALDALEKCEPVTLAPGTVLIDRAGVEHPIEDSAAPIRDVNGKVSGAVIVFRDVTERRRLEEHLRQAHKMEAIGRLAGGIAHDFNNIMTVITGFSEILLTENQSESERREAVRNIYDAGKRAAALTQQIMAFSRKQMLVPCVLNMNTVVRDMGSMLKRLIGDDIEFVTETDLQLGHVKADPTQLVQVVLNLVANARDAMRHGGRLVVSTANVEVGVEAREYPDISPGKYIVLSVADNGVGMSDEVLPHIFEPFFTTKGVGEGTGLGLATVYGIVEQSGGRITVSSKLGEGATFRVFLPRVATPTPQPDREVQPMSSGDETILLVEDDDTIRKMTRIILQRSGYKVLDAANGPKAVALAEGYPGPIHLLVTDLVMPHMPGRVVAEKLMAIKPEIQVLFMSGYSEDLVILQGARSGTNNFLPKPFTLTALTSKVRELLKRP